MLWQRAELATHGPPLVLDVAGFCDGLPSARPGETEL